MNALIFRIHYCIHVILLFKDCISLQFKINTIYIDLIFHNIIFILPNIKLIFSNVSMNISGKVLVNCLKGMSRSSTVVLAYLMLRKNMTAMDALTVVRRHRSICPNDGFLQQLAELDNKLRRERGQLQSRSPTQTPVK